MLLSVKEKNQFFPSITIFFLSVKEKMGKNARVLKTLKSPRKGRLTDLFGELVMIPHLIDEENFSLEVLFIDEEEARCDEGRESWRRRGS